MAESHRERRAAGEPRLPRCSASRLCSARARAAGRASCLVRFFGIFTTDGGASTYSCNLSATGRRREDGSTEILALSAAKDEGWGQTIDLRRDAGS